MHHEGAVFVATTQSTVIRFGVFELDVRSGELRKRGLRVPLQQQPLQILLMLLNRPGEMVTRQELQEKLWPGGTFVDFDRSLNKAVVKLREALGDDPDSPRYIETLPRRGYRFLAMAPEGVSPIPSNPAATETSIVPVPEEKAHRYRPIAVGGLVAAIALTSLGAVLWRRWQYGTSVQVRSIAVLPLDNLSGDSSQDYFADGMTDELITDLGKIGTIQVISRTSVMHYKGTRRTVPEIARELKVDAIVEGSVVRSGQKVRITAQLIAAPSDKHLWAESYERDVGDILGVQNSVALEIARQVRIRLTSAQQERLQRYRSINSAAYDAYLVGRYSQTTQSAEGIKKGLPAFGQAIELDPSYAPAYAGLADTYSLLANYFVLSPKEAFPQAKAAAKKALELDPDSPEAHTALGYPENHYTWDWVAAEREYKIAIALNPSYATAHLRYAELLSNLGRHDEAIAEIRRAQELDPLSLVMRSNVGRFLYFARRYDEAIQELQETLQLDPGRVYAHLHLGMCYEAKGMWSEALNEFEQVKTAFNGHPGAALAHAYAETGQTAQARTIAHDLRRGAGDSDWFYIASAYAALGEKDEAFRCLEKAFQTHDFYLSFLKVHPYMDPLRPDPRYSDLLHRIGLH